MEIAIFVDNFYPEISGISDSIIMIVKELLKKGHSVHIFAPKYTKKNYNFVNLPFKELDLGENFKITRFSSFPYKTGTNQGRFVLPLGRVIYSFKKFKPDIIHVHLPFGTGIEGLLAAKLFKIPLIGTNHTPMTEFIRYSPFKGNWFKKFILKYNTWFFKKCNFVSSPSQSIFDEMKNMNFKGLHKVIPNPIDLKNFKETKNKNISKNKLKLKGFTILYSGRIAKEKNIDLIIKAISKIINKIPDINFVITGKGSAENELKKLVKSLNLEKNIKFFGYLSEGKLIEVYNTSDVFVIMSNAETQCIAAMKAMACSIPVIAAKSWGLKEYINDENGFLIPRDDVDDLAEKLTFLYKNPKKGKEKGKQGKKDVQKFNPKIIADTWEKIYENTIKNHKK